MISRERAARLAAALDRADDQWNTRTSGTDSNLAFEDRRVLAAELGRVLYARGLMEAELRRLERELAVATAEREEPDEFRGGGGPGEDGFE